MKNIILPAFTHFNEYCKQHTQLPVPIWNKYLQCAVTFPGHGIASLCWKCHSTPTNQPCARWGTANETSTAGFAFLMKAGLVWKLKIYFVACMLKLLTCVCIYSALFIQERLMFFSWLNYVCILDVGHLCDVIVINTGHSCSMYNLSCTGCTNKKCPLRSFADNSSMVKLIL